MIDDGQAMVRQWSGIGQAMVLPIIDEAYMVFLLCLRPLYAVHLQEKILWSLLSSLLVSSTTVGQCGTAGQCVLVIIFFVVDKLTQIFSKNFQLEAKKDEGVERILDEPTVDGIVRYIKSGKCKNIVVMVGAGISTGQSSVPRIGSYNCCYSGRNPGLP